MKWFCFVTLLLLGVAWCQADELGDLQDLAKTGDKDDDESDLYVALKELLEKKCEKNGGKNAVKKLTNVLGDLRVCLGENLPKNTDELKELKESSSSEELCNDKRGTVRKCFVELIKALEDCAEPEEKYLPGFIFDAIDALYDYICADDGAVILKIFDPDTLECVLSLAEHNNITEVCTDQFKVFNDNTPDDAIITKAELCGDLITAKTCYGEFISKQCPHDTNFRDFIVGIYTAISAPCNKDEKNPLNLNLPGGQ